MRTGGCAHSRSRRSSVTARWEPRLSRATAWISSTMIVVTVVSAARLRCAVTSRYRDSGVVTRKFGGRLIIAARMDCVVSPVRTSARRAGSVIPSSDATSAISRSGVSRFCCTSTASAFSGET